MILLGAHSTPASVPSNVFNWDPSTQFPNFKAAAALTRAGTSRTLIGFSGESCPNGYGANAGANDYRLFSYAAFMASTGYGSLGTFDSYCGPGGTGSDITRLTLVGGATLNGGVSGWGGGVIACAANGDGANFQPSAASQRAIPFDRVRIIKLNNGSQIDVGINGGSLSGSLSTISNDGNYSETIWNVTRGVNTVNVRQVGTGSAFINTIECYDSTAPRFNFLNGAIGGQTISPYAGAATGATYFAATLIAKPHLMFLDVGINDGNTYGTSKAAYKAAALSGIQRWKAAGIDVFLTTPTPIDAGSNMESGPTYWADYRDALQEIAISENCPLWNKHDEYVSAAVQNAAGRMFDGIHYNEQLGALISSKLSTILNAVA
jgi:hypothetical protein